MTIVAYTMDNEVADNYVDEIDLELIRLTQAGIPLTPRPYQTLSECLNISETEVLQRFQRLKTSGIIRRIGAVPNHYKLGYLANGMSVWDVEDDQITSLGKQVGQLEFVTHCYQRPRYLPDWPYNLFAMVHAQTREETMLYIDQIQTILGKYCHAHDVLFSNRILKKTGLRIQTQANTINSQ